MAINKRNFKEEMKAIENEIVVLSETLKKKQHTLLSEAVQEDEDLKAITAGSIADLEKEIANKETEIKELKQLEDVQNIDWATHPSAIVRQAYASTMATHSTVSFTTRAVINKTLTKAMESTHADQVAALLQGPTGSGKTTAIKWVGGQLNRPVVSQNLSNNIEEVDIIGGPTIDGEGNVRMVDGPLTEAVRYGLIYVAEEMNFAKPGVLAILNSLLDGNRQLILPSGEIVNAAPGFKFLGTINPGYAGTRELNRALVNRFGLVIEFNKPTPKQTISIIKTRTGYGNTPDEQLNITKLILLENSVDKLIKKDDYEANISVRQHFAAVRLLQTGEVFTNAIKYGVADQVSNMDTELKTKIMNIATKISAMSSSELGKQMTEYFGGE